MPTQHIADSAQQTAIRRQQSADSNPQTIDPETAISKQQTALFIDQLNIFSLTRLLFLPIPLRKIYVFEPIKPGMRRWLSGIMALKHLQPEVEQVTQHIGQLRDPEGKNQYVEIIQQAQALCADIVERASMNHPIIKAMAHVWEARRVQFHLKKTIERTLIHECFRIRLAAWMSRQQSNNTSEARLLIRHQPGIDVLASYARNQGVVLIGYRMIPLFRLASVLALLIRNLWQRILSHAKQERDRYKKNKTRFTEKVSDNSESARPSHKPSGPTIAIRYWYRTLSLDPADRSEFFWLSGTEIPWTSVILYSLEPSELRRSPEELRKVKERGIRIVSGEPRLTFRGWFLFFRLLARVSIGWMVSLARPQSLFCRSLEPWVRWVFSYARWSDFFRRYQVKIHIAPFAVDPDDIGMVLALEAQNGISLAYQYSISNIFCPTTFLSAGEHVQLVFSPLFEEMWHKIQAPVEYFLSTGFIYDSAFETIRHRGHAARLKKQLQSYGARFILCYFDENSATRWDSAFPNEHAADDYTFLLEWLMRMPDMGLIIKVKNATHFSQRLASILPLLEQAQKTGRFQLLSDAEAIIGRTYPAQAAMAADMCVGKLGGSSAAFEARLAGTPTLLIDREGFYEHPLRCLGENKIIFNDWNGLRANVERYRQNPKACLDFGDWSGMLESLDPFQDGRASQRMASLIQWFYQGLMAGQRRVDVLAEATAKYRALWGDEMVTRQKQPW